MDPVTVAAKRFLAELDGFWNPPPGVPIAPGHRVLRLVVAPAGHGDLRKALRWLEWSPHNRRPVVLFEDAFEDEPRWLRALVAKTANDCEAVRQGLAEDGIALKLPVRPPDPAIDAKAARDYLDTVAERMTEPLDGLFVVLAPKRVTDSRAYRRTLAAIVASPTGAALRLAVLDVPGADQGLAALLPFELRFEVNRAELFAFLKQLGPRRSEGPAIPEPPGLPRSKHAIEKEVEPSPSSQSAGETLRGLLLDAGQALSDGNANLAVQEFRAAQRLCRAEDLVAQECATTMGLGSAHLAAGDEQSALAAYVHAAQHALAAELPHLAAQAMLGVAGVHFGEGRHAEARAVYEAIERLAMDVPSIVQEAGRMQENCRELERLKVGEPKRRDLARAGPSFR
jgi:hypothetical protein